MVLLCQHAGNLPQGETDTNQVRTSACIWALLVGAALSPIRNNSFARVPGTHRIAFEVPGTSSDNDPSELCHGFMTVRSYLALSISLLVMCVPLDPMATSLYVVFMV